MDTDHKTFNQKLTHTHRTTYFRWPYPRKTPLWRRKLTTVRLGGKKKPRRGLLLVRLFRRARLRWLKLKYYCMLKKLKQYYRSLMRDIIDAGATMESVQQRILMETSFAIPVMGISFNGFPNAYGIDRS